MLTAGALALSLRGMSLRRASSGGSGLGSSGSGSSFSSGPAGIASFGNHAERMTLGGGPGGGAGGGSSSAIARGRVARGGADRARFGAHQEKMVSAKNKPSCPRGLLTPKISRPSEHVSAPPSPIDPRRRFLRGPRHSAPRVREPQPPSRLTRSRAHAPRLAHDDGAPRAPIRPRRGARRGPARGLGRAVRRPRAHARAPDRAQGANRARRRPRRAARVHRARRGPHRVPDRVPRAGVAPRHRPGRRIHRSSVVDPRAIGGRPREARDLVRRSDFDRDRNPPSLPRVAPLARSLAPFLPPPPRHPSPPTL